MKNIFLLLMVFLIWTTSNSQDLKYEAGIFIGATSMQTDYGESDHFGSSYGNMGFGIGGVGYLSFDYQRNKWDNRMANIKDHIRLRAEISYMKSNLVHKGKYTQGSNEQTVLYNAMEGTSTILNYGLQIEYTIFNRSDERRFSPYISLGFLGNSNTPKLASSIGNIDSNPNLIPNVYDNGVFLKKNESNAIVLGGGIRIRPKNPDKKSIFLLDFRWQRFNSDIIEGLTPKIKGNRNNDFLIFISFGYVFSLN